MVAEPEIGWPVRPPLAGKSHHLAICPLSKIGQRGYRRLGDERAQPRCDLDLVAAPAKGGDQQPAHLPVSRRYRMIGRFQRRIECNSHDRAMEEAALHRQSGESASLPEAESYTGCDGGSL